MTIRRSRMTDRYFDPHELFERFEKKKHIVSHERDSKFSTITRAYLLGRNEELFEFYPRRGSSNSIDNWPRSKTFLLKLRRGKQINPFQRFVKRQESTWHGYHRGGEGRGGGSNRRQYRSRIYEAWILQLVRCNVIIRIRSHRSHGHVSRFENRIVWKPFSTLYFPACIIHDWGEFTLPMANRKNLAERGVGGEESCFFEIPCFRHFEKIRSIPVCYQRSAGRICRGKIEISVYRDFLFLLYISE